jgi:hypothetical protein
MARITPALLDAREENEKADQSHRRPKRRVNGRKVRENADARLRPGTARITCKSAKFAGYRRTTENRGVPGSSPGLAIARKAAWLLDLVLSGAS